MRGKESVEEYDTLLNKKKEIEHKSQEIPGKAKKSIAIAFASIFIGIACFYFFVQTFFSNTCMSTTQGRWMYLIFAVLTIPSGSYTLFVAYQVYKGNSEYNWPMIF